MFMGEYRHTVDTKGRLIIPAKFRDELGPEFVITRGMDGCLFGYPLTEWNNLEEKLRQLPLTKKNARAFVRFFYSAATECEFDKQGRINIPKALRTHAALDKKSAFLTALKFGQKNGGTNSQMMLKRILMRLPKI